MNSRDGLSNSQSGVADHVAHQIRRVASALARSATLPPAGLSGASRTNPTPAAFARLKVLEQGITGLLSDIVRTFGMARKDRASTDRTA